MKPIEVDISTPEIELYLARTIEKGYRTPDAELSPTSENPVQNKVVTAALNDLEETVEERAAAKLDKTSVVQDMKDPSSTTVISTAALQTLLNSLQNLISQKAPLTSPRFTACLDLDSSTSLFDGARALVSGEGNQIVLNLMNYNGDSGITVRGLSNPTQDSDVATKAYVDAIAYVDSEDEV